MMKEIKIILLQDKPIGLSLRHMLSLPDFAATLVRKSYDVRRVEITPLEQRKVTFDTHALMQDLEAHGK